MDRCMNGWLGWMQTHPSLLELCVCRTVPQMSRQYNVNAQSPFYSRTQISSNFFTFPSTFWSLLEWNDKQKFCFTWERKCTKQNIHNPLSPSIKLTSRLWSSSSNWLIEIVQAHVSAITHICLQNKEKHWMWIWVFVWSRWYTDEYIVCSFPSLRHQTYLHNNQ